ncbi:hypothetical protein N9W34_06635, partial [Rickettsiales bacterium]|nr:hypothetical protein [Rickettsiales bacterium]
ACKYKGCFLELGAETMNYKRLENGKTIEVYRIPRKSLRNSDNLINDTLDAGTLGLWNVFSSHASSFISDQIYTYFRVNYDENKEIQFLEILTNPNEYLKG